MTLSTFSGPQEIQANLNSFQTIGSFGVQATHFETDPSDFEVTECPNLFVAVFNRARRASYRVAGNKYKRTEFAAGDVLVVPQTADWIVDFDTTAESLCVFIPPSAISNLCVNFQNENVDFLAPLAQATFRSPLVEALIRKICLEAKNGAPSGSAYSDVLVSALVSELEMLARPESRSTYKTRKSLDRVQLDKITSFVDGNLDKNITTQELGELVGMTTAQFSREFKKAHGLSPYQFVLEWRIYRAKEMLSDTLLSIAQIAYSTGFSSQAHMTEVFRSKLGLSPGKLRQTLRS